MPTSKKPRKAYRPKPVIRDTISYAMAGVTPMMDSKDTAMLKRIANSDALAALCQGRATVMDMDVLVHMHNTVEALWLQGFGKEYAEVLIRGKAALLDVCNRGAQSKRFLVKAEERQALNDLLELHDAQMEVVTVRDMVKADAKAIHEIVTGKAIVIRDNAKIAVVKGMRA
jgi:hypothetical protein